MLNYTEQDVQEAVKNSTSIRQVLNKIGLREAGGNYACIRKYCTIHNISTSHFTGQGSNKGKYFGPKRPLSEYLVCNGPYIGSHKLKLRLIKEKIFEHKCYKCNNTFWLELPIPIELEHINGNKKDCRLENLTLLCPNCHAQTPTYRGKNIKRKNIRGEIRTHNVS